MKQFKLYLTVLLVSAMTVSCSSDDESSVNLTDVLVINEGNFTNADGTLSGYDRSSASVDHQLFEKANGFPVTATIQNVTFYNNKYFIVGNSPDKIEVVNVADFKSTGSISANENNLANPFMFVAVGDKGYISNWGTLNTSNWTYENPFITVVNLNDFTVIKKINLDNQPQGLLAFGNKIFIAEVNTNSIAILNTTNDEITGSITTSFGPDRLVLDKNDKIWAICRGGSLAKIDPSGEIVETTIEGATVSGFNEKMIINKTGDKLYWLATVWAPDFSSSTTSVFEMSIEDTEAPTEEIISGSTFYGLGIDQDNVLYIGDHNGFQGAGTVYRYDLNGNKLSEFESGIAPNGFLIND